MEKVFWQRLNTKVDEDETGIKRNSNTTTPDNFSRFISLLK